jgi:predicted nucleic acid-binding protein
MNGNRGVLDSNFINFGSRGEIDFEKLRSTYDEFYVSIIAYMEVYAFDFKNEGEKTLINELFANLEVIEINKEIADQTIIYRKNKNKKIKLPDAIILATAKYINADLLTNDQDDFQDVDASVNILGLESIKL